MTNAAQIENLMNLLREIHATLLRIEQAQAFRQIQYAPVQYPPSPWQSPTITYTTSKTDG